jgi:hypothetical protein
MANNQYSLYHFKTRSSFETKVINSSGKTYSEAMALTTNPCYYKLCLVSATDTGKPFIYTHGREWDGQMLLGNQIPINNLTVLSGEITANDTISEAIGKILGNFDTVEAKLENVKVGMEDVNSEIEDLEELYLTEAQIQAMLNLKQDKVLKFTNLSADTWVDDTTYADFPYRCDLSCAGVTANNYAEVVFDLEQATSGNYAPVCETNANTVSIWSLTQDSIIVPTIVVTI